MSISVPVTPPVWEAAVQVQQQVKTASKPRGIVQATVKDEASSDSESSSSGSSSSGARQGDEYPRPVTAKRKAPEVKPKERSAAFTVTRSDDEGYKQHFRLEPTPSGSRCIRVGRSSDNEVVVSCSGVSGLHAEIWIPPGKGRRLHVRDLSVNGTGLFLPPDQKAVIPKGTDVPLPEKASLVLPMLVKRQAVKEDKERRVWINIDLEKSKKVKQPKEKATPQKVGTQPSGPPVVEAAKHSVPEVAVKVQQAEQTAKAGGRKRKLALPRAIVVPKDGLGGPTEKKARKQEILGHDGRAVPTPSSDERAKAAVVACASDPVLNPLQPGGSQVRRMESAHDQAYAPIIDSVAPIIDGVDGNPAISQPVDLQQRQTNHGVEDATEDVGDDRVPSLANGMVDDTSGMDSDHGMSQQELASEVSIGVRDVDKKPESLVMDPPAIPRFSLPKPKYASTRKPPLTPAAPVVKTEPPPTAELTRASANLAFARAVLAEATISMCEVPGLSDPVEPSLLPAVDPRLFLAELSSAATGSDFVPTVPAMPASILEAQIQPDLFEAPPSPEHEPATAVSLLPREPVAITAAARRPSVAKAASTGLRRTKVPLPMPTAQIPSQVGTTAKSRPTTALLRPRKPVVPSQGVKRSWNW